MSVRDVLLLGNPKLYEISEPVQKYELERLHEVVNDLHDTLMDFKKRHGAGRAIAAPQIGVMKRLIYIYIDYIDEPKVFINPMLNHKSNEMMVVWDDCICVFLICLLKWNDISDVVAHIRTLNGKNKA